MTTVSELNDAYKHAKGVIKLRDGETPASVVRKMRGDDSEIREVLVDCRAVLSMIVNNSTLDPDLVKSAHWAIEQADRVLGVRGAKNARDEHEAGQR